MSLPFGILSDFGLPKNLKLIENQEYNVEYDCGGGVIMSYDVKFIGKSEKKIKKKKQ